MASIRARSKSIRVQGKAPGCYRDYVDGEIVNFVSSPAELPGMCAEIQQTLIAAGIYAPVRWFVINSYGMCVIAYLRAEESLTMVFADLAFEPETGFAVTGWYDPILNRGSANHPMVKKFGGRVM